MAQPAVLDLEELARGMPGLSPRMGAAMAEAAAVCLDDCGHHTPVPLTVDGDESRLYDLEWAPIGDQARRAWADEQRATEEGAYGIAILVVSNIRGHAALGRSMRGSGFDYWMGDSIGIPFKGLGLKYRGFVVEAAVRYQLGSTRKLGRSPPPPGGFRVSSWWSNSANRWRGW